MSRNQKLRVVLVPFPFQSHMSAMLELASLLHSLGFSITIAHTKFNTPNYSHHPPEFTFLPLEDNIGHNDDTSFSDIVNAIAKINASCLAPFQDHMLRLRDDVACVIYDSIMKFADTVAREIDIPTVVLRTSSAAYLHAQIVLKTLLEDKLIPLPESKLHEEINPQVHPLRFKDLPHLVTQEIPQPIFNSQNITMDLIRSSSAVIWNTVDALEHDPLSHLHHHLPRPFFTIGPLHKMAPSSSTNLAEEDIICLSWLDKQHPSSVIYVSLGSLAIIDENELMEMANGLANSGRPFLWAIRPTLLGSLTAVDLFSESFKRVVKERGCIVDWAPQRKVLAHPAVGGFLTHCGWNSTLESMSEGVPMICRPCFADQIINTRYVSHVWRVGVELDNALESGIERGVRKVMSSEEGQRMRERALRMKQVMEDSMKVGGSSYKSVNELVKFITSLVVGSK